MDEEPILSEGGVTVTRTRFVVAGRTYATSNITSVVAVKSGQAFGPGILITAIALVVLFASSANQFPLGVAVGLVAVAFGMWTLARSPFRYVVVLRTSGGEISALQSQDLEFVKRVRDAVGRAITTRADDRFPGVSQSHQVPIAMSTASPLTSEDPMGQLAKVAELHKAGVLTDEEFAAKKKQLLGL
jgi:hypothetical protein